MKSHCVAFTASLMMVLGAAMGLAQDHAMSFFITSVGLGKGGDLGGVEGADAHCQKLADSPWRARPNKGG
jgi:hypothetical protein